MLHDKVILVTGAGQGIGRAIALTAAKKGADVAACDLRPETLEETARMIRDMGRRCLPGLCDVSDPTAVNDFVAWARTEFGRLDGLVNNAGFDRPGTVQKVSVDDFQAVLGVHLVGALNAIKAVSPLMIEQGRGRIVNLGSIYGKTGGKGEAAYCSAKAALVGLTKTAARELGPHNITVNLIQPGLTRTPTIETFMAEKYRQLLINDTPLGRMAEPEEIAAPICFLLSAEASFITGAVLDISGGCWM
jgi:NAD(P)-dependent dehydrogenase (short-subunit alcohol dehydrogenase family)